MNSIQSTKMNERSVKWSFPTIPIGLKRKSFMAGTNWDLSPAFCPGSYYPPFAPHFVTSAVLVVGKSFSLSLYQKLREFHWLSGSLLEAVGWICPSKEVFLSLALNKKRSQWSMSCSPLVLPTEAWRLPLQMGLQGTHTNWITWATQIASFLSQQLLHRTLQHHHEMML